MAIFVFRFHEFYHMPPAEQKRVMQELRDAELRMARLIGVYACACVCWSERKGNKKEHIETIELD